MRMGQSGPHPLAEFPGLASDSSLSLKEVFDYSVTNDVPFATALEAVRAARGGRQPN